MNLTNSVRTFACLTDMYLIISIVTVITMPDFHRYNLSVFETFTDSVAFQCQFACSFFLQNARSDVVHPVLPKSGFSSFCRVVAFCATPFDSYRFNNIRYSIKYVTTENVGPSQILCVSSRFAVERRWGRVTTLTKNYNRRPFVW